MKLTMDLKAWEEGFKAGEAGRLMSRCPYLAATTEAWSYHGGWIEGDAKRQGYSYSRGTLPAARGDASD
jgi:ribosome modulation factor